MAEILLVNPRRRKRRKSATRSRRRRHSAPRAHRRRRRRTVARRRHNVYMNPRHRRSRRRLTRGYRRRRNPSLRGSISGVKNALVPTLKAGLIGATGALGLDLLWGYGSRYLPATIAGSAWAQYAAKLLGAILVGMLGNKLMPGRGRDLAVGASTVVLHDALKAQIRSSFPSVPLGEYLTYAPAVGTMRRAGRLLDTGMGEYLHGLPNAEEDGTYSSEYTEDSVNGY